MLSNMEKPKLGIWSNLVYVINTNIVQPIFTVQMLSDDLKLALHETKRDSAQPLARKNNQHYKVGLAEWSKALDLSSNTQKCA